MNNIPHDLLSIIFKFIGILDTFSPPLLLISKSFYFSIEQLLKEYCKNSLPIHVYYNHIFFKRSLHVPFVEMADIALPPDLLVKFTFTNCVKIGGLIQVPCTYKRVTAGSQACSGVLLLPLEKFEKSAHFSQSIDFYMMQSYPSTYHGTVLTDYTPLHIFHFQKGASHSRFFNTVQFHSNILLEEFNVSQYMTWNEAINYVSEKVLIVELMKAVIDLSTSSCSHLNIMPHTVLVKKNETHEIKFRFPINFDEYGSRGYTLACHKWTFSKNRLDLQILTDFSSVILMCVHLLVKVLPEHEINPENFIDNIVPWEALSNNVKQVSKVRSDCQTITDKLLEIIKVAIRIRNEFCDRRIEKTVPKVLKKVVSLEHELCSVFEEWAKS